MVGKVVKRVQAIKGGLRRRQGAPGACGSRQGIHPYAAGVATSTLLHLPSSYAAAYHKDLVTFIDVDCLVHARLLCACIQMFNEFV